MHRSFSVGLLPRFCRRNFQGVHQASAATCPLSVPCPPLLSDSAIDTFRVEAFAPQRPVVFPPGSFRDFPAIQNWFDKDPLKNQRVSIAQEYLRRFGNTIVPLELTGNAGRSDKETFHKFEAPLQLFLDWLGSREANSSQSLYLAQASVRDLPEALREDISAPDVVLKVGKGDVYDANLWIGFPPTYTPLHRDPNPNLFVQLAGRKVIRMLPPDAGDEVFAAVQVQLGAQGSPRFRGFEMMEGPEKTVLERIVWDAEHSQGLLGRGLCEAEVMAGDGIFIPTGWWHSVKGIGKSVTASVNWWFR